MTDRRATISSEPLDAAAIETQVTAASTGAVVTFRGIVRDHDHGLAVSALEYRAHPDAERFLEECCAAVSAETGLSVAAAHRVGQLTIGDVALVASLPPPTAPRPSPPASGS